MTGPRPIDGARAPLFDRLVDDDQAHPHERHLARRILDAAGVRESIAVELARLANTRAPIAADRLAGRRRSTIDYGLPDLSYFLSGAGANRVALARLLEQTIAAFEPRLLSPRVTLGDAPDRREALIAEISGKLAVGTVMQPVSFTLALPSAAAQDADE
jgi:type VI secretion system protein ImpF